MQELLRGSLLEPEQFPNPKKLHVPIQDHQRYVWHQRAMGLRRNEILNLLLALRGPDAPIRQLQPLGQAEAMVRRARVPSREV